MKRPIIVGLTLAFAYGVIDALPATPSWLDAATAALVILAPSALIGFYRCPRPFARAFALITFLVCLLGLSVWLQWTFGVGRQPEVVPPPTLLLVGIVGVAMVCGAVGAVVALASRALTSRN